MPVEPPENLPAELHGYWHRTNTALAHAVVSERPLRADTLRFDLGILSTLAAERTGRFAAERRLGALRVLRDACREMLCPTCRRYFDAALTETEEPQ